MSLLLVFLLSSGSPFLTLLGFVLCSYQDCLCNVGPSCLNRSKEVGGESSVNCALQCHSAACRISNVDIFCCLSAANQLEASYSFESLAVSGFTASPISKTSRMLQLRQLYVNTVCCVSEEALLLPSPEQWIESCNFFLA